MMSSLTVGYGANLGVSTIGNWYHPYKVHLQSINKLPDIVLESDASSSISLDNFINLVYRSIGENNTDKVDTDEFMLIYEIDQSIKDRNIVTRADAAHILSKVIQNKYGINKKYTHNKVKNLVDYNDILSHKFSDDIINLVNLGVFSGDSQGRFDCNRDIKLSEAIVTISKTVSTGHMVDNFNYKYVFNAKDYGLDGLFTPEERGNVLGDYQDTVATAYDLELYIAPAFGQRVRLDFTTRYDREITVSDLLDKVHELSGGKLIKLSGDDKYIYTLQDSAWLSEAEWTNMITHMNDKVMLSSVMILANRTKDCMLAARNSWLPDTAEDYKKSMVLLPGMESLTDGNEEAIEFWINGKVTKEGSIIRYESDFETTLHELQHEVGAVKSDVFSKREFSDGTLYVHMDKMPEKYSYFNVMNNEWVELNDLTFIKTQHIDSRVLDSVKLHSRYNQYVTSESASANVWGIYGILTEFCSSNVELKAWLAVDSFGVKTHNIRSNALANLFWRGVTLEYLSYLSEKHTAVYDKFTSDKELINLIVDCISFTDSELAYRDYKNIQDEDIENLYNWAYSDKLNGLFDEIQYISVKNN